MKERKPEVKEMGQSKLDKDFRFAIVTSEQYSKEELVELKEYTERHEEINDWDRWIAKQALLAKNYKLN
jgi:hypothetical protein